MEGKELLQEVLVELKTMNDNLKKLSRGTDLSDIYTSVEGVKMSIDEVKKIVEKK